MAMQIREINQCLHTEDYVFKKEALAQVNSRGPPKYKCPDLLSSFLFYVFYLQNNVYMIVDLISKYIFMISAT